MNIISRRHLISTTALAGTALALEACVPTTTPVTNTGTATTPVVAVGTGFDLTKAASIVSVIANAASSELPEIKTIFTGGAANTVTKIEGYVGQLGTLAGNLATATAAAAPTVGGQVLATLSSVVGSFSGMTNLPAGLSQFVTYVQALTPVIQVAAGVVSLFAPGAPGTNGISEQQAVAGLIALTQKRA